MIDPTAAAGGAEGDRRQRRNAARRRREAVSRAARQDDLAQLRTELSRWLTPPRVDILGAVVAAFLDAENEAGRQPRWGEILTGTALPATIPFPPPAHYNAAGRQEWRNAVFGALMEACRQRGWVQIRRGPVTPGPRAR